ncbi:MAG: metallophosphoesterase [bacterium]|nr:metallophosphoesterase [bacterium]
MKKLLLLVVFVLCQGAWAEPFTLAVLPDTQCEMSGAPAMFASQMNWIAANRRAENIRFVIGVGDIINWDTPDHRMWTTASEGFKILDAAGLPYALALGNHDTAAVKVGGSAAPGNVRANLRVTTQFNRFFPVPAEHEQRGRFEEGKSDNAWYRFDAGGLKWLVLTLELWPRQAPIDWAKSIVAAHPDANVIVATHSFLTREGTIMQTNGGYGDTSPQSLYDQLISQYPNVLLVLCGHTGSSAWRDDVGPRGNRIYQLLQDYQGENSGGGYIRLLEIDTEAHAMSARMYSPYLDRTRDDASAFSFKNVEFIGAPAAAASSPR